MVDAAPMIEQGDEHPLPLADRMLQRLGWRRLVICTSGVTDWLPPLLADVRREPCVHAWRSYLPASGPVTASVAENVLAREALLRPTTTFAYVAEDARGRREVAAAATVAARIRSDFPWEGVPVLARSYVRPGWRGIGVYRAMLEHRLAWCAAHWGERLLGVHLGAANAAVWHLAMETRQQHLRFVHVGDEMLPVGTDAHRVRDLVAFAPAWREELIRARGAFGDGPAARALDAHVAAMVDRGLPEAGGAALPARVQAARDEHGVGAPVPRGLAVVLDLFDAIPLLR